MSTEKKIDGSGCVYTRQFSAGYATPSAAHKAKAAIAARYPDVAIRIAYLPTVRKWAVVS